ncbi:anti-Muellerian hormone type-2 receptor-like [Anabas testudineus]|uniref:receptor protein serine/threonine kinase n=1 Tax=Anabas testudineus TaxID=64144 RepID=A0A7N6F719_ANATE|nr:anti-Muellerian hormone type-2 receptor-like [Anabas testudineus]XP_026202806.1 anti-Muellerian hormone type-2 receptor-like [Anabas testudineus]XP_026202807.1 anti-Muellerian hormone type-2 receptor-like [Anabas testudineus]
MKRQLWQLVFTLEGIFISSQSVLQKRRCVFQATTQNNNSVKYTAAGNVNGSVQVCENTLCCVGYFRVTNGQPEVDVLACDIAEKACPDATCKPQTRFNGRLVKCVCNTDLCNGNILWIPEQQHLQLTYSNSADEIIKAAGIILIGTLIILCFMVVSAKSRSLFTEQKENLQSCFPDYNVPALCSCQQPKASEIDIADIELQQILDRGHFATVWQGKYQQSTVAVKVFPSDRKHRFSAEKEVYELPLMKHAGIVHFLGTGGKPDGSCIIVLQFAEYGSLHSYLCKHASNWRLSLKLCQSLSEGLSYLHSDLRRDDVHKPSVAHRDLSSSNVLVRADGTCALCDFGCSTILRSCSGQITNMEGHAQMGTLRYMSPEILEGFVNLNSSLCLLQGDVYSLGLLLWEIWMRCSDLFEGGIVPPHVLPYESELGPSLTLEDLIQFVFHMQKRPTIPKYWEWLPQGSALHELMTDCWDCDPDARLTVLCVLDRLASLQSCYSM